MSLDHKKETYYINNSIYIKLFQKIYFIYSKIGKETRDGRINRGMFKSMMER